MATYLTIQSYWRCRHDRERSFEADYEEGYKYKQGKRRGGGGRSGRFSIINKKQKKAETHRAKDVTIVDDESEIKIIEKTYKFKFIDSNGYELCITKDIFNGAKKK